MANVEYEKSEDELTAAFAAGGAGKLESLIPTPTAVERERLLMKKMICTFLFCLLLLLAACDGEEKKVQTDGANGSVTTEELGTDDGTATQAPETESESGDTSESESKSDPEETSGGGGIELPKVEF